MDKKVKKIGFVVLVALLVVGLWKWSKQPAIDHAEFVENRFTYADIFRKNCAACHGLNGEGENPLQPKGGMHPNRSYIAPALNGTGHSWHHDPAMILEIVTHGSQAQNSSMRGFKGRLTKKEIQGVIFYFQSLWPKEIQAKYKKTFPK